MDRTSLDEKEKYETVHEVEEGKSQTNARATGQDRSSEEELAAFDRKINLKLDLLIIPLVTTVYLLAFLDRANIGNARIVRSHWPSLVATKC
jgi:hypothetical protein